MKLKLFWLLLLGACVTNGAEKLPAEVYRPQGGASVLIPVYRKVGATIYDIAQIGEWNADKPWPKALKTWDLVSPERIFQKYGVGQIATVSLRDGRNMKSVKAFILNWDSVKGGRLSHYAVRIGTVQFGNERLPAYDFGTAMTEQAVAKERERAALLSAAAQDSKTTNQVEEPKPDAGEKDLGEPKSQ